MRSFVPAFAAAFTALLGSCDSPFPCGTAIDDPDGGVFADGGVDVSFSSVCGEFTARFDRVFVSPWQAPRPGTFQIRGCSRTSGDLWMLDLRVQVDQPVTTDTPLNTLSSGAVAPWIDPYIQVCKDEDCAQRAYWAIRGSSALSGTLHAYDPVATHFVADIHRRIDPGGAGTPWIADAHVDLTWSPLP